MGAVGTVLITGGSRGIGREAALLTAKRGWRVAIGYAQNVNAANETIRAIQAAGGDAFASACDVQEEAAVAALFDETERRYGAITGVVNNAGIVAPKSDLADYGTERMRAVFETNILGAFFVVREAARRMPLSRGGKGGSIVNVSSAAARLGAGGEYVDYAASKGAIDTMTVGLSKELAGDGVRVNAVRPGLIETDIHASGGQPDRVAQFAPSIPMGRGGTATEVAETILWLLGDASSYVTGALLDVSGGR